MKLFIHCPMCSLTIGYIDGLGSSSNVEQVLNVPAVVEISSKENGEVKQVIRCISCKPENFKNQKVEIDIREQLKNIINSSRE